MASAQGQDRSAYQAIYSWSGLNFGFAKATNGLGLTDPAFAANWENLAKANIPRGAYHELTATASMTAQAAFFVATVRARGLKALDMLAVVASDYAGITDADVEAFCDEVVHLAGPHNPMIVYTDLSVAVSLRGCTKYPLWVSWPEPTPPPSVAPWSTWHFWQWSWSPVDKDAFNGTPADLHAWLATYAPGGSPAPAPGPVAHQDQEENLMLLNRGKGAATPIAIPPGTAQLLFTTVFGATPHWAPAELEVNWHQAKEKPVTVKVNPDGEWPRLDVPAGVAGACVFRTDGGSHDVSAALVPAA